MKTRRTLSELRAPDERGAEERAWRVVRSAYVQRGPVASRLGRSRRGIALALAAALSVVLAVALSPAGATVGGWIRHALGIPHASGALFSLPTRGHVLVSGPGGTWTIAADGSARRVGSWREASWSPRGKYLAVVGTDELAAVDPRGTVRWALARRAVSDPRWYPPIGFRVAYLSGRSLRVVAGDGTGDHLLDAAAARVAPAWRPAHPYELAYVDAAGRLLVRDADSGAVLWAARAPRGVRGLAWSADGTRLLVSTRLDIRFYAASGGLITTISAPLDAPNLDVALSPDGRSLAIVRGGTANDVVVIDLAARRLRLRRVLSVTGLREFSWSPDGRWLLVTLPTADQWVFVHVSGKPRVAAVSRIARQFGIHSPPGGFPRLEGWCCMAGGGAG
jgi:WD40-like Beta Propeller Repeat